MKKRTYKGSFTLEAAVIIPLTMALIAALLIFALAIFAVFTNHTGKGNTDWYGDYDFPIISAERQEPHTLRIMSFNIRVGGVNGNTTYDRITIGESQILETMASSGLKD